MTNPTAHLILHFEYEPVSATRVPAGLCWVADERETTPFTEVAYAGFASGGEGSLWRRITSNATRRVEYARLKGETITYTRQDRDILRRAGAGMGTSTYQPSEADLPAAQRLMDAGLLEKEPGFDTLTLTAAGRDVYADLIDASL